MLRNLVSTIVLSFIAFGSAYGQQAPQPAPAPPAQAAPAPTPQQETTCEKIAPAALKVVDSNFKPVVVERPSTGDPRIAAGRADFSIIVPDKLGLDRADATMKQIRAVERCGDSIKVQSLVTAVLKSDKEKGVKGYEQAILFVPEKSEAFEVRSCTMHRGDRYCAFGKFEGDTSKPVKLGDWVLDKKAEQKS